MTVTPPARPSVVVVGGGYAGIHVARALDDLADVTLIEAKDQFMHNVAALRALADPAWLPRIFFPYDRLLARGTVLRDRVVKAEPGAVTLASGAEVSADYLVLATGSAYPFPAKSDRASAAAAQERYRAASAALAGADRVLLIGAGAVGVELAGEIAAAWPGKRVTLVDAAPDILGERFRADLKAELRRQLANLGVEVLTGSPLRALPDVAPGEPGEFAVVTEAGREISADLWFRCYGVTPASDFLAGDLAAARDGDGYVTVGPCLQVSGQERVFALGDVAAADHKMAGLAGRQAQAVAASIQAMIEGRDDLTAWERAEPAILVPLGPDGGSGQRAGVAELITAEQAAQFKGRELLLGRYAELFGTDRA